MVSLFACLGLRRAQSSELEELDIIGLLLDVESRLHLLPGRDLVLTFAPALNWGHAQAAMHPRVVVVVEPVLEIVRERGAIQASRRVELVEHRLLGALHLAVEVRRSRWDRPLFYAQRQQAVTDFVGQKLRPIVGLQALDGKRCVLEDVVEKEYGIGRCASRAKNGEQKTSAVIHKGVLVEAWSEFEGVHLRTLTRQMHAIALGNHRTLRSTHGRRGMAREYLMDGLQREEALISASQLVLDPARAEFSFSAQRQDPAFF